MDKKSLTEQDIRTKYILPALTEIAGWDRMRQLREEFFITDGRVMVSGNMTKRGKRKKADYVLFYKPNIPIAIVEAKDNKHKPGDGMQQALEYAEMMDVPFVYSCNGDEFLEHDRTATDHPPEKNLSMDQFPTPAELWERYKRCKGISRIQEKIVLEDYYSSFQGKTPRYYQMNAINRTIEAIAGGQNRILLVMATGTGKTYTAFQIIWRLWKAKKAKRVLFLADRNILVDQTITNDFKPFAGHIHKIKKRTAEKSYEIYMALYQAVTGPEEEKKIYKKFSPDFFDLVVVDECHRGSARDDSEWREILDYFSSAVQIGMTATPKETEFVSNTFYFGEPVYTYSLRQGIEDGFLAPYKVIRVVTDKDDGWRPTRGQRDKNGHVIPDRYYTSEDYDKELVLEERNKVVAQRVSEFLCRTNRMDKTIVFCVDQDHAGNMRHAIANENPDLATANRLYVVRITGDDGVGKKELDNFIDPQKDHPVIATTSRLMSTGVDAQTCKLIVINRTIKSMSEFKQIIGRGTRIREDYNKMFFTIIDFRGSTKHFADPTFDGDPVRVYEPGENDPIIPVDETETPETDAPEDEVYGPPEPWGMVADEHTPYNEGPGKYYVNDVPVRIINERVQYTDAGGKLITESMRTYCRKSLRREFESLDEFLTEWNTADRKKAIIDELEEHGIMLKELQEEVGGNYGVFDLICHVAFDRKPMTRLERVSRVKRENLEKYSETARAVLEALLDKYADHGIEDMEDIKILKIQPFNRLGTPSELVAAFGGKQDYLEALRDLTRRLYDADAA